jgi:hypothetical protein
MKGFKDFIHEDEAVKSALKKLPKHHQKLLNGFEFRFQGGNTLKGDDGHIGSVVVNPKKIITIAAPWRYSREFTLFHEVGHLVWTMFVKGTPLVEEWSEIVKKNPDRKKSENDEENFCHSYAAHFADEHAPEMHSNPDWAKFIEKVCSVKKITNSK